MLAVYVLALACGALAAPTRKDPQQLSQLPLTFPLVSADASGSNINVNVDTQSSLSSTLSRPISSLLHAAADTAQHLTPNWLASAYSASTSGSSDEPETERAGDVLEDYEEESDEALLDAWLNDVAEWENAHEPCIEACRVRMVPGAKDAEDALCSPLGLESALECAQCIDSQWTPDSHDQSATAEYLRIEASCLAQP